MTPQEELEAIEKRKKELQSSLSKQIDEHVESVSKHAQSLTWTKDVDIFISIVPKTCTYEEYSYCYEVEYDMSRYDYVILFKSFPKLNESLIPQYTSRDNYLGKICFVLSHDMKVEYNRDRYDCIQWSGYYIKTENKSEFVQFLKKYSFKSISCPHYLRLFFESEGINIV